MEYIELIHGTSSVHRDQIAEDGLRAGTSLTNDEGIADYFAEEAVGQDGGDILWVHVRVPTNILEVDFPMLEEPVLGSAENLPFSSEEELHNHLEEIGWPEPEDWKISLDLGGGVKVTRAILPEEIVGFD